MLQNEGISKINEIKTFFKDNWLEPSVLHEQLKLIKFSQAKRLFKSAKTKGVDFHTVIELLLFLPMLGMQSINHAVKSKTTPTKKKDVYYRGLANQKIDWRQLLWLISKRSLSLTPDTTGDKCLIFDDTEIEKTGKTIEGISKIHSHVSGRFFFGFKLLVAGYWDGEVLIPVDFSFHRESKNNKKNKYGLTKKERKNQNKTNRDKSASSRKRYKELNMKKTQVIVEMFKRVTKRKIPVDYILIDSWFTTVSLMKKFLLVNNSVHIIGMYKYNSEVIIQGKSIKIKQLKKGSQKIKRARNYGMYYRFYDVLLDGLSVRIFIIRKGTNGAWHTILSTDKTLNFTKMMNKYSTRWSIEVFFKETKQLLNLGKNQSTNFDVQVAQTTITMIQYQMLSLKYRIEAYQTIGGMFREIKQDVIENKLNERIITVISEILTVLEYFVEGLDLELTIRKLIQYSDKFSFLNKINSQNNKCKSAA